MKKIMKKSLLLMLFSCLMMTGVFACGKKDEKKNQDSENLSVNGALGGLGGGGRVEAAPTEAPTAGTMLEPGYYRGEDDNGDYCWLAVYENGYGNFYDYSFGICDMNYDEENIVVYIDDATVEERYLYDAENGIIELEFGELFYAMDNDTFLDWWASYEDSLMGWESEYEEYEEWLMGTWRLIGGDTEGDVWTAESAGVVSSLHFYRNDGTELACNYEYKYEEGYDCYEGMIPAFTVEFDDTWYAVMSGYRVEDDYTYYDETTQFVFGMEDDGTLWMYIKYWDDEYGEYYSGTLYYEFESSDNAEWEEALKELEGDWTMYAFIQDDSIWYTEDEDINCYFTAYYDEDGNLRANYQYESVTRFEEVDEMIIDIYLTANYDGWDSDWWMDCDGYGSLDYGGDGYTDQYVYICGTINKPDDVLILTRYCYDFYGEFVSDGQWFFTRN